ncbi:basic proline-rich protein-like [Cinclus cinclus]|uniref:basic proline-rich protein-like n=1 Tax=Cinclus cinclus TaxID=127875 RepID=UPI002E141263
MACISRLDLRQARTIPSRMLNGGTSRAPRGHSRFRVPRKTCPEKSPSGLSPGRRERSRHGPRSRGWGSRGRAPPVPCRAPPPPPPGTRATAGSVRDPRPLPSRARSASRRDAARLPLTRRPEGACLVRHSRSSCRPERREPCSGGSPKHGLGGCRSPHGEGRDSHLCPSSTHSPWRAPPGRGPGCTRLLPPRTPEGGTHRSQRAGQGRAGPGRARPRRAPTDGRFKPQHPLPAGSAARPGPPRPATLRPRRSRQPPREPLLQGLPKGTKSCGFF